MSQSGKINLQKESLTIRSAFKDLFMQLNDMAILKDITLINTIDENSAVIADKDLTAIIIRNLISNAIKFTHRNGEIEVSSKPIMIGEKNFQKITITDTGLGIEPNKLKNLFRIDKTESSPGTEDEKGTGLGLLLCQEFVEKQGGKISVESTIGKGSEFSFTLPSS